MQRNTYLVSWLARKYAWKMCVVFAAPAVHSCGYGTIQNETIRRKVGENEKGEEGHFFGSLSVREDVSRKSTLLA